MQYYNGFYEMTTEYVVAVPDRLANTMVTTSEHTVVKSTPDSDAWKPEDSYPYFTIAKEFNVPYCQVLHYLELLVQEVPLGEENVWQKEACEKLPHDVKIAIMAEFDNPERVYDAIMEEFNLNKPQQEPAMFTKLYNACMCFCAKWFLS